TDVASGQLFVGVIGGTSLACPIFSGVMAIAAQKAGHGLGQAAPLLYRLSSNAVRDVGVPAQSATNVSGSVTTAAGTTVYSAADLAMPESAGGFLSALYQGGSTRWYVLGFNTDTSLAAGPGWDNVTGVGAPNGLAFITEIAAQ